MFSGTRLSGRWTITPAIATTTSAATAATIASGEVVVGGPDRDDDERHLEAFEEHAFERQRERVGVEAGLRRSSRRSELRDIPLEDLLLVVQWDVARGAQQRLAQPLQPEAQQQEADDDAQGVQAAGT